MREVNTPGAACPHCGAASEEAAYVDDPGAARQPSWGDVAICAQCQGVSIFTGVGHGLRLPSPRERAHLDDDPTVAFAQAAARQAMLFMHRRRN